MMKKSKYDNKHLEEATTIVRNNFCQMCREHEGSCRTSHNSDFLRRCWTAHIVMKKIKKIFDKYDK